MYVSIDLKYLDKNRNKMIKKAMESIGDDGKHTAEDSDLTDEIQSYEFSDGVIDLSWSNDLGFFGVQYTLTDDEMMNIVKHMKRKGEKIRELVKLADGE